MNSRGIAVTCAAFILGSLSAATDRAGVEEPAVEVSGGLIRGMASGGGALFIGVPFARPPVGPLRWKPPQPVEPWVGVREATTPSPDALQPDDGAWNRPMIAHSSEDCLYLNVLAPRWPANSRLPVIVFVHGGGNFAGGAWEHLAKGVTLQDNGVLVVTINYRLGIFGFFSHPGLSAESPERASGNYALQDLLAALRWVKGNIAGFGGDPGNVTMMGQSAGALDIGVLLASGEARGLFSKVIVESAPGVGSPDTPNLAEAEASGTAFAASLGCADVAALRSIPGEQLLAAAEKARVRGRINIDGWILKDSPARIFASGRETKLPMLIGTNARESSFKGTTDELRGLVSARYGSRAEAALELYGLNGAGPIPADPVLGGAGAQFLTDITFRQPTALVAQWHRSAGAEVWLYLFSQTPAGRETLGASHSSEMPFIFGEMATPPTGVTYGTADKRLSSEMQRYWANFASTGNPNGHGLAAWPAYEPGSRDYLELAGIGDRAGHDFRRAFFELYREDTEARIGK
jgi:para-nitrobenzyl esterase